MRTRLPSFPQRFKLSCEASIDIDRRGFDNPKEHCYSDSMMRRRVLKFLCAVALGLMVFDNIADAAGCPDTKTAATICHACSCGPHLVSPGIVQIAVVPVPVPYTSYKPTSYALFLSVSIFHPPCLAA